MVIFMVIYTKGVIWTLSNPMADVFATIINNL